MKNKINLYSINKKTIYKVIIFHFIFILFLSLQFKTPKQNKKNKLIVNNIIEKTAYKQKIIKNINPKIIPQKNPTNSTPPKKTIAKNNNYENLINKLEKQIKDLDKSQITFSNETKILIPKKIKELNIDKIIKNTKEESSSKLKELLIKELQQNLKLPEFGEVKVSFMIYPTGEIKDIIILEHQSNENQKYLKNSLSELLFKSINKMFDEPQKFIVIFKNE